ncbi:ribonuclease H protein, partial [Trifolium medium]|nr:ribonuclease H protein [Trifolium medium]
LKIRWKNCLVKASQMNFLISHIYREGNHCADKLASLGLAVNEYTWWSSPPICIREELTKNRLGLPSYRFC